MTDGPLSSKFEVDILRPKFDLAYYPWFRRCNVRILIVADGGVRFTGGGFGGLSEVLDALATDPWFWVRFQVTKAHRGSDPTADIQNFRFDTADLVDNYNEIWLFGIYRLPSYLTAAELNAIDGFMDAGGGVLVTGDHEDLGAGLASGIKRAGKMRRWDPNSADPTLRAPSQIGSR